MSQILGNNPDHSNGAGRGRPRLKLLLADDNPALLLEFQRVLDKEFEIVSTVADGGALLEQYDRLRPEVIVTDISMPLMDGFEAVAKLRHRGKPRGKRVILNCAICFFDDETLSSSRNGVLKPSGWSFRA
jgi:PleD family two-component response regulator